MQERHLNKEQYFQEQAYTTKKYVIPYVRRYFIPGQDKRVLEIGCGEGGNLKPFLDAGCKVTGIDLSPSKIDNGRKFFNTHPLKDNLSFICDNVYNLAETDSPFDFIFMRDVIEHIHDQEQFMHFVKRFLSPNGCFFLAFPPWQNPFGGHQQICSNRFLARFPWIHLLPARLYALLLKLGNEPKVRIEALLEIKQTGLTIERFDRILIRERYKVLKKDLYMINPNYEVKFEMKPRKTPAFLQKIPFVRNLFTTSAYYLIARKEFRNR
jgi:SAM-dependent methyltransferase